MGFPAKPPTANRSRPSRRPYPSITTDGCPFFHDAKSRSVETHLAVRHQLPTTAGVRLRAGVRPHQTASAPFVRASSNDQQIRAPPDSSLRPPCPDPAILFPLPRAHQPSPLYQINLRSSIHGDQSTFTWHASVCTPSA
ncbi:hypothetical protein ACLOJK_036374 [Asimina triloba]